MTQTVMFLIFSVSVVIAQPYYKSNQSNKISFYSKAPLEDIHAVNKDATSIIDIATRNVAFKVPIKSFKFENALMQEHFNENYMHSDKYPEGTFAGKIIEYIDLKKDGEYDVTATGKLTIHGVTQNRTIKGKLIIKNKTAIIDCKFDVFLKDHQIKIPKMVVQKIAEKIEVTVHSENFFTEK
jgi:polyisoprenoid-binding protein YceI